MVARREKKPGAAPKGFRGLLANPAPDEWRRRIDSLMSDDERTAVAVLHARGFSTEQALKAITRVGAFGATIVYAPRTPPEFRDPTNPCCFAVQILHLGKLVREADATSLQVGRVWGRAAMGLQFPEIAKAMEGWWLKSRRRGGGAKITDLTRTLSYLLTKRPEATRRQILAYLESDDAEHEFGLTEGANIHITGVKVDEDQKVVRYEDRARKVHKLTFESFDHKIRHLRKR